MHAQNIHTAFLLNEVSDKKKKIRNLTRSFRTFCRILPWNSPLNFWCFPGRSKSLSLIFHQIFHMRDFKFQISPENFTTHFCRHGNPNTNCSVLIMRFGLSTLPGCFGERLRGNTIRGNRIKSHWEGNRPLRGRFLEDFQEVFKGFREICRGFQRSSQRPSQRQIFLSDTLGPVAPNRAAP